MQPYPKELSKRLWLIRVSGLIFVIMVSTIASPLNTTTIGEMVSFVLVLVSIVGVLAVHEWQKRSFIGQTSPGERLTCSECGCDLDKTPDKGCCSHCGAESAGEQMRTKWQRELQSTQSTLTRRYPRILARRLRVIQITGVVFYFAMNQLARRANVPWLEVSGATLSFVGLFAFLAAHEWTKVCFVKRVRADDCRMCPACGYNLIGLPDEGLCPECGLSYALAELREMWRKAML